MWTQKLKSLAYMRVCDTKGHLHTHTHAHTEKNCLAFPNYFAGAACLGLKPQLPVSSLTKGGGRHTWVERSQPGPGPQ